MPDGKPRILYFIASYPTFSETYMHEEILALRDRYEIEVISLEQSPYPRREAHSHRVIPYEGPDFIWGRIERMDITFSLPAQRDFVEKVDVVIEDFRPDILHGHYLGMSLLLRHLAERHHIPFTIRSHSFDAVSEPPAKITVNCEAANSGWCERVLVLPPSRQRLLDAGLVPEKLVDCWPVMNFERFYNPEPRPKTGRVICAGPAIHKKAHREFIDLAALMRGSGLTFDLYTRGELQEELKAYNSAVGNPANITYADPVDMGAVYPRYDWLVYTADKKINKVGSPLAVAEAQASGIGVCWQELPGRRDEQLEYLAGAGFLYKSIEDVPAIISEPYPEEMRRAGFEAVRRCDIQATKHLISEAWDRCLATAGSR